MQELTGRLFLSQTGYLILTVPNAIGWGAFQALREPGIELPRHGRPYSAHITVMRPEEVQRIGAEKITERGQEFTFRLQGIDATEARRRDDVYGKYWYWKVSSPQLSALRRSYGLDDPDVPFHITFAARRRGVLVRGSVTKQAMRSLQLRRQLQGATYGSARLQG